MIDKRRFVIASSNDGETITIKDPFCHCTKPNRGETDYKIDDGESSGYLPCNTCGKHIIISLYENHTITVRKSE